MWGAWDGQNLNFPPFPGYNFQLDRPTYGHIIQYIHITHPFMYVLVNTCIF